MKNLIYPLCLVFTISFVFFNIKANAQESKAPSNFYSMIYTRFGTGSFREFSINGSPFLKKAPLLSFGVGYRYPSLFSSDCPFFGTEIFLTKAALNGPTLSIGLDGANSKSGDNFAIYLQGRLLHAKGIEYDAGCYSGSNEAEYSVYDVQANDINLKFYHDFKGKNRSHNFYLGFGFGARHETKRYSVKGYFHMPLPSDEVIRKWQGIGSIDFGYRLSALKDAKKS